MQQLGQRESCMACQHYEAYQRRRAQRGNEREKMWFAMLLILFSTITISVSFNRSSARTLKFI